MQVLGNVKQSPDRSSLEPQLLELTAMLKANLQPLQQRAQSMDTSLTASFRACCSGPLPALAPSRVSHLPCFVWLTPIHRLCHVSKNALHACAHEV